MKYRLFVATTSDAQASITRMRNEGGIEIPLEVLQFFTQKYKGSVGSSVAFLFTFIMSRVDSTSFSTDVTNRELADDMRVSIPRIQKYLHILEQAGLLEFSRHPRLNHRIIKLGGIYDVVPDWYVPCPMVQDRLDMAEGRDVDGLVYGGEKSGKTKIKPEESARIEARYIEYRRRIA